MEKNISVQSESKKEKTEIAIDDYKEIAKDSAIKKFFIEVSDLTTFTFRFFKK